MMQFQTKWIAPWNPNELDSVISFPDTPFPVDKKNTLILAKRGSDAHGTYIPPAESMGTDDKDILGVVLPPLEWYFGLRQWEGAESMKGEWDVVLYEFRKFFSLLKKQNPNVLSVLWLRKEDYLYLSPIGNEIIWNRSMFRSRKAAYDAFVGYAYGQLKRMTHFSMVMYDELRKVEDEMERRGINMQNPKPRTNMILGGPDRVHQVSDDVLIGWRKQLKGKGFSGYMGEKRMALVKDFGYDTKNAAHLIRLLNMGIEYLQTGLLTVRREHDRDLILGIKRGEYKLEQVQKMAEERFVLCKAARETSCLPETIDDEWLEKFLMSLMKDHFGSELSIYH